MMLTKWSADHLRGLKTSPSRLQAVPMSSPGISKSSPCHLRLTNISEPPLGVSPSPGVSGLSIGGSGSSHEARNCNKGCRGGGSSTNAGSTERQSRSIRRPVTIVGRRRDADDGDLLRSWRSSGGDHQAAMIGL